MADASLAPDLAFALTLVVIGFATTVKAALGFGLPLIAVPLAANLIGARTAVILIAIPVVFSNLLVLLRGGGGGRPALPRFAGLLLGIVVGTITGAQLLGRLDARLLSLIVGGTALAFAALAWRDRLPAVSLRGERYAGPLVGLASGIMGGTTGIFAPVIAPYMYSLRLEKRAFVFWVTASFFVGGVVQVVSYYALGLYTRSLLVYAVVTFIPVIVGTRIGFYLQDRMPAHLFRRLVLLLVVASSLNLIFRQIF